MQQVCMKWENVDRNILPFATVYVRVEFCLLGYLRYTYVNQLTNKLIACNARYYFNSMCINHVMYPDDIDK